LDKSASLLKQAYEAARRIPDAATARRQFAEMRATFFSLPTNEAVFAIRQFLDSKADAPTHLGFKVAGNGLLEEAPTWRIFLLDELARLDPAAAADYAKVVLASMDSSDEWAVALRNLARGDTSADARALLERKTNEMLGNEVWRKEPSVGFLEAFDVAVYLGGTTLLPTLTDSIRLHDNSAVAHASFLALDRLVINEPTVTLAALQGSPDLMTGRESSRANYFARADAGDPRQRQILESYLLDERLGAREIDAFAGVYPNANFMLSNNLLTQTVTPDHATLLRRDAEALKVVRFWLADPRFARVRPGLERVAARLEGFVQQMKHPP
jgi:hypothetical protein